MGSNPTGYANLVRKIRITAKWRRMAEIYRSFSEMRCPSYLTLDEIPESIVAVWNAHNEDRDFSEDAALEAYRVETFGGSVNIVRPNGKINGFIEGKKWMDLMLTEYWLPDLAEGKTLFAWELYEEYPSWFLDKVLPSCYHQTVDSLRAD